MSNNRKIISQRLRIALRRSGMNQTQLSEKAGVTREYINSLLNDRTGTKNQQLAVIESIAAALGVSKSYLTGEQQHLTNEIEEAAQNAIEENKRKYKKTKMKDFLKIYGIEMHHDKKEGLYILVDADNRVVWKGCSTESLTGLFNMIENLYKVGSDIISCFFKDVYIDEI